MAKILTLEQINASNPRDPLTPQQYAFSKAYADHGNGMRAVREAGYQHATAGSQSSASYRLLRKDKIRQTINMFRIAKNG